MRGFVEDYPRVAQQAKDAGWELWAMPMSRDRFHKEPDQKAMIDAQ